MAIAHLRHHPRHHRRRKLGRLIGGTGLDTLSLNTVKSYLCGIMNKLVMSDRV
ncbi:MAG: hypothetical protein WBA57_05660 [Elainellaceae cyanobacterium]